MRSVFSVTPFDSGWCVKIESTGEALFFKTCGLAERRALKLAAEARPRFGKTEIVVRDGGGKLIGRWLDDRFEPAQISAGRALKAA